MPRVAVVMPVFEQAAFLPRAVASLCAQTEPDWELVVVDDGSTDDVAGALAPFAGDARVVLHRLDVNAGIGAALNLGIERSSAPLIAYLPADDVLHDDHLATLCALSGDDVVLAYSVCAPADRALQLVQIMHRRTSDRWLERAELESDDLERLLLGRLRTRGAVAAGTRVTCQWSQHPAQRHRRIRESRDGGVNAFRSAYRVQAPLRLHSSETGLHDEVERYRHQRERPAVPRSPDGLRILLAGELAFNPDRVIALQERGHELLGLWIDDPLGFNTVGPLPFGGVEDLDSIADVRPGRVDVIYALLNWRAVPLAHALLEARTGVPLVFHFKEAPQRSIARGEEAVTRSVLGAMRAPAADLCGATSLGGFAALLSEARLLVGSDTGTAHLAAAMGVPAVVVFLSGDPVRWSHAGHRVARIPVGCNPCPHLECPIDFRCAGRLSAQQVVAEARAAIADRRLRPLAA